MNNFMKDQEGSILILVGLMLAALIGFLGLPMDIGNIYVVKTKMQNTVDAAVCAGGLKLPDTAQATAQARSIIANNNFDPDTATITFTQNVVKNPGNAPQINCSMTNNVQTFIMGVFGINTVPVTASAEAILIKKPPRGPFDYTIFSGSDTLNLILNGSQTITGSVHANNGLNINGSGTISGAAEGQNGVSINGTHTIGSAVADTLQHITVNGSNNIGSKSGGALDIAMPDFTQQITDTAAQTFTGNKTFNGSVDVTGNIHVEGDVTLNGSVNSTGAILADGNIIVNGTSSISGSDQACLYSKNGNITINGTSFLGNDSSEIIYAPNGTIILNGSMAFHGRIIGNRVIINGSENIIGQDYPVTSLPGKNHVKLIQ